jgi:hypothetical protein
MTSERTAYDNYMDELVLRISNTIEGEDLKDVIAACSAIIAYSIRKTDDDPDKQERLFAWTIDFMREVLISANTHLDPDD